MKILVFIIFLLPVWAISQTKDAQLQRVIDAIDVRSNTQGLHNLQISNTGNFVFDYKKNKSALIFPNKDGLQYVNSGGVFFAAKKRMNGELRALSQFSYNVNNPKTIFVPGRIEAGAKFDSSLKSQNQIYNSNDYESNSGVAKFGASEPNWPLWKNEQNNSNLKIGAYIFDEAKRTNESNLKPAILSDEDMFATYKDTDLSLNDRFESELNEEGYPLFIQFEQSNYYWNYEQLKNTLIIGIKAINRSSDTLFGAYLGAILDIDITKSNTPFENTLNDNYRVFDLDNKPNNRFISAWSDTNNALYGKQFYYMGITAVKTPIIDENGKLINQNYLRNQELEKGTSFVLNLPMSDTDVYDSEAIYSRLKKGIEVSTKSQDIRLAFGTGAFDFLPNDTARFFYAISFAPNYLASKPEFSLEDMYLLRENLIEAQYVLNEQINKVQQNSSAEFKIYPNPTSEILTIDCSEMDLLGEEISILDLSGNLLISKSNLEEQKIVNIDISNLLSGVYFIKFARSSKISKFTLIK